LAEIVTRATISANVPPITSRRFRWSRLPAVIDEDDFMILDLSPSYGRDNRGSSSP